MVLDFSDQYPDAKIIKLEQNYRSTGNILSAAYSVVCKNQNRAEKKLWTKNPKGNKIQLIECYNVFDLILAKNDSYTYFWESIFILHKKKYKIGQIPVQLPYRKIGSSKMQWKDIFFAIYYLAIVFLKKIIGKYNYK